MPWSIGPIQEIRTQIFACGALCSFVTIDVLGRYNRNYSSATPGPPGMLKPAVTIVLTAFVAASIQAQSNAPLPTEEDTVVVGRTVVISSLGGEVLLETGDGALVTAESGLAVEPGQRLLVRKGAWFSIGRTTFGPESHGDRWVRFQ